MLAKSHVNIGFLAAITTKSIAPSLPALGAVLVFNLLPGWMRYFVLAGITAICITLPGKTAPLLTPLALLAGCMVPDLDEPNSTGSQLLAPTRLIVRVLLVAAGAILVAYYHGVAWAIVAGIFLIISGVLNLQVIPMESIQRFILITAGILVIAWAPNQILIGLGVLYLAMGMLSHRGLTHSLEGLVLMVAGAFLFMEKIGHPELLKPFAIGLIAHYLADMLTDHGVFASYIGKLKISIPIITTSSVLDKTICFVAFIFILLLSIGGAKKTLTILENLTILL